MISSIIKWWKNRNKKVSVQELYEEYRYYNKSILIKEIIVQSQLSNRNQCGVPGEFKKELREYSKKHLIKTLVLLRLENNKKFKKLQRKLSRNIGVTECLFQNQKQEKVKKTL